MEPALVKELALNRKDREIEVTSITKKKTAVVSSPYVGKGKGKGKGKSSISAQPPPTTTTPPRPSSPTLDPHQSSAAGSSSATAAGSSSATAAAASSSATAAGSSSATAAAASSSATAAASYSATGASVTAASSSATRTSAAFDPNDVNEFENSSAIETEADKAARACSERMNVLFDDLKSLKFTVEEEQDKMNEIGLLTKKLQVHQQQRKIEQQERKEKLEKEKEEKAREFIRLTQESNNQYLDHEYNEWEKDKITRKALIQDVVEEAMEEGNPIPKSVMKLIDHFKGSFAKFSKSLRGNNAIAKASLEIAESNRKKNDIIIEMLTCQREHNQKMNSYVQAKIPNMNEYFPLPDRQTLLRFLDPSDGLYPLRRAEFYNFLVTNLSNKNNLFGTALMRSLFSGNFLKTQTWPPNNTRYPKKNETLVPFEFVGLLKMSLARMSGAGILDPCHINLAFWNNWPKKFREAKRYIVDLQDHSEDENEVFQEKKKKKSDKKIAKKVNVRSDAPTASAAAAPPAVPAVDPPPAAPPAADPPAAGPPPATTTPNNRRTSSSSSPPAPNITSTPRQLPPMAVDIRPLSSPTPPPTPKSTSRKTSKTLPSSSSDFSATTARTRSSSRKASIKEIHDFVTPSRNMKKKRSASRSPSGTPCKRQTSRSTRSTPAFLPPPTPRSATTTTMTASHPPPLPPPRSSTTTPASLPPPRSSTTTPASLPPPRSSTTTPASLPPPRSSTTRCTSTTSASLPQPTSPTLPPAVSLPAAPSPPRYPSPVSEACDSPELSQSILSRDVRKPEVIPSSQVCDSEELSQSMSIPASSDQFLMLSQNTKHFYTALYNYGITPAFRLSKR